MHASRFIACSRLQDGTGLFYSFFTLSLLALEPRQAERARRILSDPDRWARTPGYRRLATLLARHGFLVPNAGGERARLERDYRAHQTADRTLSLTILPTLACNFACTYCYEGPVHAQHMGREVEDALARFARERTLDGGTLAVTWYGGEPLLRKDAIGRLSRSFRATCAARSARYDASIVTNGYLLDGATAAWLREEGVTQAQVTLDGPARVHDARRPLAGGGGTFARILGNLAEATGTLEITIRVNLDATNRDAFAELLDALSAAGLADKVGFYPGRTTPTAATCADVAAACLGLEEFSLATLEASLELTRRGLADFSRPSPRHGPCGATAANSFVVTPTGGLVTCWNYVNDPDEYVGHLLDPDTPTMARRRREWATYSPFDLACGDCEVLPICMSACPYLYREHGELACVGWKLHPGEHLLNQYRIHTLGRALEVADGLLELRDAVRGLAAAGDRAPD